MAVLTIEEWAACVGRHVVFTYFHGERQLGTIASVNARYVFVRFDGKTQSESCDPERLELVR